MREGATVNEGGCAVADEEKREFLDAFGVTGTSRRRTTRMTLISLLPPHNQKRHSLRRRRPCPPWSQTVCAQVRADAPSKTLLGTRGGHTKGKVLGEAKNGHWKGLGMGTVDGC